MIDILEGKKRGAMWLHSAEFYLVKIQVMFSNFPSGTVDYFTEEMLYLFVIV